MYSYELLEAGCYYLIREKENDGLLLIKVHFKSDYAVCLSTYIDGEEITWKRKSDSIFDIIECLDDKAIAQWEKVFYGEDAYYEDDDDE